MEQECACEKKKKEKSQNMWSSCPAVCSIAKTKKPQYAMKFKEESYDLEIVKYMIAGFEASKNFINTNLKIEVKIW